MKIKKGKALIAVIIVALVFGLATPAIAAGEKYGDTFVVGVGSDPQSLNGSISSNFFDKIVTSNIYSMLIRLDYKMNPVSDLAENWNTSDDNLTYTFNLRSGVKWHDGTPFTSADVKFTIEEVIMELHPRSGIYKDVIESVESPDDNTVVINLKTPYGAFMNAIGYDFLILPKHLYENTDIKDNPYNNKPVGTGPFLFEEWVRGDHITLTRNPDYFQEGLPYLDRLIFKIIPDASSRVLALETGEVDYLSYQNLPSSAVPNLKQNKDIVIFNEGFESLGTVLILTLNNEIPELQDVRVRKAISMAVDRDYISERADYGLGVPANSPFASTSWAYEPEVTKYPYDLEKAAQLLDEAGYKPGKDSVRMTLRLTCDANVELNRKAGDIVKANLAGIGIKVDYEPMERGAMLDRVYIKRNFDMQIHGLSTGADPAIDVARLYISSNIRPVNFSNGAGYRNDKVDELFDKGVSVADPKERAVFYKEAQKIITDEAPMVWLLEQGLVGAHNAKFNNVHSWSAYSYYIFWDVWSDDGQELGAEGTGIETPASETPTQEEKPTSSGAIVGILAFAALAVVVTFVLKRKANKGE